MRSPSRTTRALRSRSRFDHSSSRSACEYELSPYSDASRAMTTSVTAAASAAVGMARSMSLARYPRAIYARGIDSAEAHTANVLGAVVDALARDVEAATSASASGPGGRAAALAALAAFASGSPIDRLAGSLGLSHSRVVRLVDQLEAEGDVMRAPGAGDRPTANETAARRTVNVTLTDAGRSLAAEIATARLSVLRAEVDALDGDDRAALDRICATVLARRVDSLPAAERTCGLDEPQACGHPQRRPVPDAPNAP